MLDETMTYSCAVFERPTSRSRTRSGASFAGSATSSSSAPTTTCSRSAAAGARSRSWLRASTAPASPASRSRLPQAALARERARAAGLDDRSRSSRRTTGSIAGSYTKIASIEMIEAIGRATSSPIFFAAIDRLLAPGGRACIQTILVPRPPLRRATGASPDWIERYVFPGCLIPSLAALDAADGRVLGAHGRERRGDRPRLRRDPARAGARASTSRSTPCARSATATRFERTWDFYLAFCEGGFRSRALRDAQLVSLADGAVCDPDRIAALAARRVRVHGRLRECPLLGSQRQRGTPRKRRAARTRLDVPPRFALRRTRRAAAVHADRLRALHAGGAGGGEARLCLARHDHRRSHGRRLDRPLRRAARAPRRPPPVRPGAPAPVQQARRRAQRAGCAPRSTRDAVAAQRGSSTRCSRRVSSAASRESATSSRRRLFNWTPLEELRLDGRIAIVTGATSGLGRMAAELLARQGAALCIVGRDAERTERARAELAAMTGAHVESDLADLSLLADAAAFAERFSASHDRLDILVHNAGALTHEFIAYERRQRVDLRNPGAVAVPAHRHLAAAAARRRLPLG